MNDLSCHLKSLEIYLIDVLNARHHFVFQWISLLIKIGYLAISFNKDSHLATIIPTIICMIDKSHEEG
jgi:hypothetical protein